VKFKSRSLVQVVENANNEVIGGDVFQMDDLVDPYRPPPYAKLKKIQIFMSLRILMLILIVKCIMRSTLNSIIKMMLDMAMKKVKRRILIKRC